MSFNTGISMRSWGGQNATVALEVVDAARARADRRAARAWAGARGEAIALWERGEELYKLCRERLDGAQGKIEELAAWVESAEPAL